MTERKLRKLILSSIPTETDRLLIRYIRLSDAQDMFEYASIPDVSRYLLWAPHINLTSTEGYIESLQKRYYRGLYGDWAIELKEINKMIGTIGYANIISKEKTCEIGYVLSPKFRKCGYMTEALENLIDLSFNLFKFEKILLRIIAENKDSISLAEKLGFTCSESVTLNIKGQLKTVLHYIKYKK